MPKYNRRCTVCMALVEEERNYHEQCGIFIIKLVEGYKEKISKKYSKVVTTKTKRVRAKILEYFKKMNIGDTFEVLDFVNRTTKIGTTIQAIGNILSDMANKNQIIKISDWKNNSPAIWGRVKEIENS